MMQNKNSFSIAHRLRSFGHAFDGIGCLLRSQHNAWIHALATVIVVVLGLVLGLSTLEWVGLVLSMGVVWSAEAFNSALEAIVDQVSPDFHPLAKRSKDLAAGAVLLAAISAAVVGLLILGPKLWLAI